MGARHWSDEDILAGLYGVGPMDGHSNDCADCRRRWELMRRRQEELRLAEPNLSGAFLASQRRAIMARTEAPPRSSGLQLVPWLAAVGVVARPRLGDRAGPKLQSRPVAIA